MHKSFLTLFLVALSISTFTLAAVSAADIAYILEDSSSVSSNIVDGINSLGLTYDVVKDSQIASKDFSGYSLLLVTEEVDRQDLLPFDEMHAMFFDRDTAQEVWPESHTSVTTNGKFVKVVDSSHEIFDNIAVPVDGIISLYGDSGYEMHYLRIKPSYVNSLAIRTNANRPVIASSTREINDYPVRDVFFGAIDSTKWNADSKTIFKNSLTYLLEDIDQDEDGWAYSEDCDDQNANINPDEDEIPYDLIDQNCDGYDLLDVDNDGYCAKGYLIQSPLFQCPLEPGLVGTDCNDQDDTINQDNPDPTLNCINDAPTITDSPDYLVASEGDKIQFDVTATDPEDNQLTFSIDSPDFVVTGNHFSWQTGYHDSGIYTFTITVSDSGLKDNETIQIEIFDSNMPPELTAIPTQTWPEDTAHEINLGDYFYDFDSDELTFGVNETPNSSAINIIFETTEIATITPAQDYSGQVWVIFYADDGEDRTYSNHVILEITNVNDPVTFNSNISNVEMNEDTSKENAFNLYDHFTDIDSTLNFEAFGNTNVQITFDNGYVTFTPSKDFAGVEQVYIKATDEDSSATSNTFTITVYEQGEPPEFSNVTCETTIAEDTEHECTIEATDFEGNDLTFSIGEPENLQCSFEDNILTYQSEENYNGIASCELIVSDIHGNDTTTLEVNVTPVNDAPEIPSYSPEEETVRIIEGRIKTFSIETFDPDSETTTEWFSDSQSILTTASENSEVDFSSNNAGNYIIKAIVSDEEYETQKLWNIIVGPISDFTCEEAGGNVCGEDKTCFGDYLGVKDTDVCCATACIPSFDDVDSCDSITPDFTIEITEINDDDKIEIGDEIRVEVDITNNLDEDQDVDLEIHLYNLDSDNSESEVETDVEIKEGRSREVRLDLEIPDDLDLDDSYAIFVVASDDECAQAYETITIKRPEENVQLTKFELPETAVCGETVTAKLRAENLGSKDQDVRATLENRYLDIDEESNEFDLEEYGDEDRETIEFSFKIPEDAESGTYDLRATLLYDSERVSETKEIEVECRSEQVRQSTSQPSSLNKKINLNSIGQNELNPESEKSTLIPAVLLMMFNIILVASIGLLYITSRKK